jgi:2,3-diketo-5-methylthio-1-phosphopentane phosphatase
MSRAPLRPTFDGSPTPVSLLIDFDGTISLQDVGDALLRDLVADQAAVRHMDQLYHEGRKGSRELTAWDMDVLPRDVATLHAVVDALSMDDSFVELVRVVRDSGAAIEVVSDGVGFHVERMLARLGLQDLPVATNATVLGRGADGVTFPYGHPACHVCGTCKRERIRAHQRAGRAVVFVGDGPSDRYAAHHADVIFAKWSLADWCRQQRIAYEPWERLADVAAWFEAALADGRLPGDADLYDAWASGARPAAPTFICGPETWPEGRTTAISISPGL